MSNRLHQDFSHAYIATKWFEAIVQRTQNKSAHLQTEGLGIFMRLAGDKPPYPHLHQRLSLSNRGPTRKFAYIADIRLAIRRTASPLTVFYVRQHQRAEQGLFQMQWIRTNRH